MAGIHHIEIWVADLEAARAEWGWLLGRLGFTRTQEWEQGESWSADDGGYLTLTTSPNLSDASHDGRRPGVNHLAFVGGGTAQVDAIISDAPAHGWNALYAERYPHAGGETHYAGWLENGDGFKAEVVAVRSDPASE